MLGYDTNTIYGIRYDTIRYTAIFAIFYATIGYAMYDTICY